MDAPDVEPQTLDRSLRFIRRVNTLLGYTRSMLAHFKRFSAGWKPGQTISILDVATGSADIPRAIAGFARRNGFSVRIVGLDRHDVTAGIARRESEHEPAIRIVRGDAMSLPFDNAGFDYVITSMFAHHLDDADVVRVLREMNRVARRGIIWSDLLRHYRAYYWISAFTIFAGPMIRHDARVSVAQAFTKSEVLDLRDRAGVEYARYLRHFGHRFVLAGEKQDAAGISS